ncbi:MAG: sulfite exporter TauE/SafE family protein [Elusimicrobia bacterium]|nr:sulfite exporter TauE/SafE family protein [Candidatus Obscuribacterium magneticum]MCB4755881.1 sulfite exporter TauE/SafE family protein [Candidatus Obscuribacterium magneticum]
MIGILVEGFTLGLATGTTCLVSCAPLLVPFLLAESRAGFKKNVVLLMEFMGGRLAAYVLFGWGIGALGHRFAGQIPSFVLSLALFLSGLFLILYALAHAVFGFPLCRFLLKPGWKKTLDRMPFLLGFLVGLNICPPFVAGVFRVLELGSPWGGLGYFSAFYAGTSLYLFPLLTAVPFLRQPRVQRIGQLTCVLAGLWFMTLGLVKALF